MNFKTPLLAFGIFFFVTNSVNGQTTAYKSPNKGQLQTRQLQTRQLQSQDRLQQRSGSPFLPTSNGFRSRPRGHGLGGQSFGVQQRNDVPMQSVIVNGRVVLLPALSNAAQLELTELEQLQQQQRQQNQSQMLDLPQVREANTAPARTLAAPKPLRVKSKFFDVGSE